MSPNILRRPIGSTRFGRARSKRTSTPHRTARPGSRAPHFWLPDGRSSLDLFREDITLLEFSGEFDSKPLLSEVSQSGLTLRHECITDAQAAQLYGAAACIVRPDGFVAWRGNSLDATEASYIISRVFGL